ncbi:MAG: hypothetical protein GEU86_22740 [Actinophytocola sp.]|nr:hypothetical protein [Actinophytocola sp.]
MPSSLIIVALAVAWLVVLVPMVARKRQEIARTGDDALASRIVRSGGPRGEQREERMMSESADEIDRADDVALPSEADHLAAEDERMAPAATVDDLDDEYEADVEPAAPARRGNPGRYRPGRGGFDPEAAELAARAKYAFRQRVVVSLLATVVISAAVAGFVLPEVWWVTGAALAGLVGYLAYLRRQVRIEEDIRQRRLARLGGAASAARRRVRDEVELEGEYSSYAYEDEYEITEAARTIAGVERKPRPHARQRRNTVVVDIDDEDPAFHELSEPGPPVYRRAVGE